jgi:hypothetical protein
LYILSICEPICCGLNVKTTAPIANHGQQSERVLLKAQPRSRLLDDGHSIQISMPASTAKIRDARGAILAMHASRGARIKHHGPARLTGKSAGTTRGTFANGSEGVECF